MGDLSGDLEGKGLELRVQEDLRFEMIAVQAGQQQGKIQGGRTSRRGSAEPQEALPGGRAGMWGVAPYPPGPPGTAFPAAPAS